jgi:hypothetical protein
MRLKVRLKLQEPWASIIPEVAKQCNMTVEDYCRRAVQLVTKQGIEEGEKRNAESRVNDPAGNATEVRTSTAAHSNALANTAHP